MELTKEYYSITEASKLTGISREKLYEYCNIENNKWSFRQVLPNGKRGKYMIKLSELVKFIEKPLRKTAPMKVFNLQMQSKRRLG